VTEAVIGILDDPHRGFGGTMRERDRHAMEFETLAVRAGAERDATGAIAPATAVDERDECARR